ncbi:hypothetical protein PAHAL_2G428900 [Panicum hallii]|uniref:Uncharacterized protein n=1 Tax=Panicum hallii TaxID=206008 RepID=A0A2T8KSF7_9POAL|nr:hypothetical protein PAHAL_2G428900 [Panicum hallii]
MEVAALDTSLATAPPFKGVLRGYVLPTAPYTDAALLKAAAESGSYAAAPFVLLNHVVVGAKITLLDEAREQLENIVAGLNALQSETLGGARTQMMGRNLTAAQLARAAESSAQWEDIVEHTRREAQLEVGSTKGNLKSIISIVLESASA